MVNIAAQEGGFWLNKVLAMNLQPASKNQQHK